MANVAVFGGGIAGLTAAHELASRGHQVTVYEAGEAVGGKARSQWVDLLGDGRKFPGEHGFRFFPSYYKHIPASMRRIPRNAAAADPARALETVVDNVAQNFVPVPYSALARDGVEVSKTPRRRPRGSEIVDLVEFYFDGMGLTAFDMGRLAGRMLGFYQSCDLRRLEEFEPMTWGQYILLDQLSEQAQRTMRSFPKCLVAMDADQGSSFTIGNTSFLLLMDQLKSGEDVDRVLNGPTTKAWLDPWKAWLDRLGVCFDFQAPLERLDFDPASGRIRGARLAGRAAAVTADYYILAMPLDRAQPLITREMAQACGECRKLTQIRLDRSLGWMVGAQFYLREDNPVAQGHVFYPDSPWALTSVSQAQFWAGDFGTQHGHGQVSGILSVDVSDWARARGGFPAARDCTRDEIRDHLIAQINGSGRTPILEAENVFGWHLDDDIEFSAAGRPARNKSQLLIHPPGLLSLRPTAETRIGNLMLASDYVRTNTDLATMEGANEAARLAVNAIVAREGGPSCQTFNHLELTEPDLLKLAKKSDEYWYRLTRGFPRMEPFDGFEPPASETFVTDSLEEARELEHQIYARAERMGPMLPP